MGRNTLNLALPAWSARHPVVMTEAALLNLPAPAKINLFLHVVGRRTDGYHLLQTAFVFIDLADQIDLRLRTDGLIRRADGPVDLPEDEDLSVRAAKLLQSHSGTTMGVDLTLRKQIPSGGGLGGGSSDAATVLLGLNRLWKLACPNRELQEIGLQLGADVPVFVGGHNALAQGIGEQLQPVALPELRLRLVWPGVPVATAPIFSAPELTRNTPEDRIQGFSGAVQLNGDDFVEWLDSTTRNDLQPVAARKFSEVAAALNWLQSQTGVKLVRMSGSGGCCFAIRTVASSHDLASDSAAAPDGMKTWDVASLDAHPLLQLALDR
jgi:4-diphosphocytidyl-2-C-methyl-D-erythritol kinase